MGSITVKGSKPQPNYFIEFRRFAFTDEPFKKFDSFINSVFDTSFFVAIYRIYLFFLICEAKCGAAVSNVVDR